MRLRFGAFGLVLASVSACFFVTDLDALRGAGAADAGVDAPGADGSADGGFCALHPGHTLCSDFDQPDPLAGWILDREPLDAGALEVSDAFAVSMPNSLRSLVVAPDSGFTYQRLAYHVVPPPKHARIELVVRACDVKSAVQPVFELLCLSPNNKSGGVWLHLIQGAMKLRLQSPAGTGYAETAVDVPLVLPFAHEFVLDVVFGTNGSVTFDSDGVNIVSQTGIDTSCLPGSVFEVNVGGGAFPGGQDCESFYDDVLVDVDP